MYDFQRLRRADVDPFGASARRIDLPRRLQRLHAVAVAPRRRPQLARHLRRAQLAAVSSRRGARGCPRRLDDVLGGAGGVHRADLLLGCRHARRLAHRGRGTGQDRRRGEPVAQPRALGGRRRARLPHLGHRADRRARNGRRRRAACHRALARGVSHPRRPLSAPHGCMRSRCFPGRRSLRRRATVSEPLGRAIELEVPSFAQMSHRGHFPEYDGGGASWCSPASLAMVLAYWGVGPSAADLAWVGEGHDDPQVDHAARHTYDAAYGGCGNWSFGAAYAAGFGLDAVVTKLGSLREVEELLERGCPRDRVGRGRGRASYRALRSPRGRPGTSSSSGASPRWATRSSTILPRRRTAR